MGVPSLRTTTDRRSQELSSRVANIGGEQELQNPRRDALRAAGRENVAPGPRPRHKVYLYSIYQYLSLGSKISGRYKGILFRVSFPMGPGRASYSTQVLTNARRTVHTQAIV